MTFKYKILKLWNKHFNLLMPKFYCSVCGKASRFPLTFSIFHVWLKHGKKFKSFKDFWRVLYSSPLWLAPKIIIVTAVMVIDTVLKIICYPFWWLYENIL